MSLKNIDSIIFDLDGTLWNSSKAISEAWSLILKERDDIEKKQVTMEELYSCMGLPMYDIAAKLFPMLSEEKRNKLMDDMCVFENDYLMEHGGELFEGLEDTLKKLKEKYELYIVSNCQLGYIDCFLGAHKLGQYFKDTECWGRTLLSKGESNKLLIQRNNLKNPVYVGDTQGDYQSAIDADIPFIFAQYGFGDVKNAQYKISDIRELLKLLEG